MNRAGQSADSRCWLRSESQVIVGEVVRGVSSVPSAIRERDRGWIAAHGARSQLELCARLLHCRQVRSSVR